MLAQRRARPTQRRISVQRVSFKFASSFQLGILRKFLESLRCTTSGCPVIRPESMPSAEITSRYRSGALPRSGFVRNNVIPPSDSANLDAVVAHTRCDETVREAVSELMDHATLREKCCWSMIRRMREHLGGVSHVGALQKYSTSEVANGES